MDVPDFANNPMDVPDFAYRFFGTETEGMRGTNAGIYN